MDDRRRWGGRLRAWTDTHRRWLCQLQFAHASDQFIFDDARLAIDQLEAVSTSATPGSPPIAGQEPYRTPAA